MLIDNPISRILESRKAIHIEDDDNDKEDAPNVDGWNPTDNEINCVMRVLRAAGLLKEKVEMKAEKKGGGRGNIMNIINAFGAWAGGKHRNCSAILAGKAGIDDPARLCAWLKDRYTGTTTWRGKESKGKLPKAA